MSVDSRDPFGSALPGGRKRGAALLFLSLFLCVSLSSRGMPAGAQGMIGLEEEGGVWWFRAPDGTRFLSKGVNCVGPGKSREDYDPARPEYSIFVHLGEEYGDWEARTVTRLREWGFNTVGGWSDGRIYRASLYTTPFLNYQVEFGSIWYDLWTEDYVAKAEETARRITKPYLDDPRVVGYFLDNEFGWGDDYFLSLYFEYPGWMGDRSKAPGKRHLIGVLRELYGNDFRRFLRDFETAADGWDGLFSTTSTGRRPGRGHRAMDAWMEEIGKRYYGIAAQALKKADPRHLLMGDRFRQFYPQGIARAAKGRMDVISTNFEATTTDGWISPAYFETLYELSGCPIVVGEFYATARQNRTGNQNHGGYFTLVDDQAQRAAVAAEQIRQFAAFPFVVGWQWFQWSDEPVFGRSDGENYNMGLVDIYDEPYEELGEALAAAHAEADLIHASSGPRRKLVPGRLAVRRQLGLIADGKLGDWDKQNPVPRALLKAREGLAPFADVFLAWDEENLWLAVRAYDFSPPQRVRPEETDPATWDCLNRLSLKVGKFSLHAATGLVAAEGNSAGKALTYVQAPPRGGISAAVSSHVDAWHYVWEVAIPSAALGAENLAPGRRMKLIMQVENRGDFEKLDLAGRRGLDIVLE